MLEYAKIILAKVSFDARLFYRELSKARTRLNPEDYSELQAWCMRKYPQLVSAQDYSSIYIS